MKKNNLLASGLIFLIRKIWQGKIGARYKQKKHICCRFYPSCSEYSILVLEKHGLIKGIQMSINRIKRCNPSNTDTCIDYP
jgi:putative component of membrane protein insertase Oxa1/YidC/SpoIIIJ protein YidD